ncbi:hypothetical protein AB0A77_01900 [Streptomyces varsoviensis]|uniref:zinc finger domain-containing protein n=1 Tax=Streptomyces varsoviensis TaxID=67373 RepID=UPI0033DCE1F0
MRIKGWNRSASGTTRIPHAFKEDGTAVCRKNIRHDRFTHFFTLEEVQAPGALFDAPCMNCRKKIKANEATAAQIVEGEPIPVPRAGRPKSAETLTMEDLTETVACPACHVAAGACCITRDGKPAREPHGRRFNAVEDAAGITQHRASARREAEARGGWLACLDRKAEQSLLTAYAARINVPSQGDVGLSAVESAADEASDSPTDTSPEKSAPTEPEHFYMVFDEGVWKAARGSVMVDQLAIKRRGYADAIEFYELPHQSGRMYNLAPALEERGWRLVSEVEYIAGRRVGARVEQIEAEPTADELTSSAEEAPADVVRNAASSLHTMAKRESADPRTIADIHAERCSKCKGSGCPECGYKGKPRPCVHGTHPRSDVQGDPVSACREAGGRETFGACREAGGRETFGAFHDEGCWYAYDCAVDVANEAARENAELDSDPDNPTNTWTRICPEHEEQPAGTCEECNAEEDDDVDEGELDED